MWISNHFIEHMINQTIKASTKVKLPTLFPYALGEELLRVRLDSVGKEKPKKARGWRSLVICQESCSLKSSYDCR
ncbi:hypothetical protein V6N11_043578 [Hibiscus sabdariffa]|uniref:Uncharacterized protein n=1 Tax=Hibiscus sabdariffa TaxID=183260 RepID=A0ABR2RCQ1_9ROSI